MKIKTVQILAGAVAFLWCVCLASTAGATNYTLTLIAQGSGTVSKNPTNSSYPSGAAVTITATPNAGWYFSNWSGDTNSMFNPLNVTMNSDMVITGNFLAYPTYSVTLTTNGQGGIALTPSGGSYLSNTVVTATATPAAGWVFVRWLGVTNTAANPVSVMVDTNISLQGSFAQLPAFDVQPASVTNTAGSTVTFTSHSVGTTPLGYTWYFSGGSLNNATNATLSLTNVTSGQAGNYWVVATNNYGMATSTVVSLTLTNSIGPTNVVNSPDQGSLQSAIALGGWVGIKFNGTVTLTNTINISNNVILDGTGVTATISGGNAVQLFNVAQGASLTISNLTLANGSYITTNGPADGGAIYNNGTLTLVGCTLTNNLAVSQAYGGVARGGALFNNGGTVLLTSSSFLSNAVSGGINANASANSGNGGFGYGGAIYMTNGSVTLANCLMNGNVCNSGGGYNGFNGYTNGASFGGALFEAAGAANIANSRFSSNQVLGGIGQGAPAAVSNPGYGGALAGLGGTMIINSSQFNANVAMGGAAGSVHGGAGPAYGGAVYSAAILTVNDSSFYGNQADAGNYTIVPQGGSSGAGGSGGAIYNFGTAVMNRCSVFSNYVQGGSAVGYLGTLATGGIGLGGGVFNAAQLTATNCTIALNSVFGGYGGSDFGSGSTTGNALGGGIFNSSGGIFTAMNLTIASNSCSSPAITQSTNGMVAGLQIANSNATFHVHNTLIAYSGTNSNAYGPITDDGYNICSDGSAALFSGSSYNYTDPQLGPLGNYGGPTLCMALLASSPAIDNADPGDYPSTDQRGYIRPFGGGPDMGAYEYGSAPSTIPYVNISLASTNVTLSFPAFPGNTYYLQYSTNLTAWINLSTNGPFAVSTDISQAVNRQGIGRGFFRLFVQ